MESGGAGRRSLSINNRSFRLRCPSLNSVRLRRIFDLFDKNSDGTITVTELSQALALLGLDADLPDLQSIVQSHIKPGNLGLEFDDFAALHLSLNDTYFFDVEEELKGDGAEQSELSQEESDLNEAFKVFDEDGDGYISAQELQVVLARHRRTIALENFRTCLEQSLNRGEGFATSVRSCTQSCMLEFDQECADASVKQAEWDDDSKVREKLHRDIEAHSSSVRGKKLSEIAVNYEKKLTQALTEPVESLLEFGGKDTWPSIRELLRRETETAISGFSTAVAGFELDEETFNKMMQNLKEYARIVVEKKAREEAGKVLILMKDRFSTVFNHDHDSMPRVWTGKENIRIITKDAYSASLKLLSVMAAIRLNEKPDKIENVLFSSLMDGTVSVPLSQDKKMGASPDPLASSTWEEVPPNKTLITPVQCKSLWRQFKAETEYIVTQAISAQEAHKRSSNWLPPPWAIVAMVVLGFNEFMLLLKNPLYLMVFFIIFLLSKALWVQMDLTGEFHNGNLAGLLAISSRFLPTVMNLLRRLAEEAQGNPTPQPPRPPPHLAYQSSRHQTQQSNPAFSLFPDSSVSSNISSSDGGIEHSEPQPDTKAKYKS